MKKTYQLLSLLLLCLLATSFTIADWVTSVVDERISVQTPIPLNQVDMSKVLAAQGASKEQIEKIASTKILLVKDAVGSYMVMRFDNGGPDLDYKQADSRNSFYDGYISSMVNNDKGVLLERTAFKVSGFEGVDFKYKGIHKFTKKMVVKYNRALMLEKMCYALIFIPSDNLDSTGVSGSAERTRFYSSIAVKPANVRTK